MSIQEKSNEGSDLDKIQAMGFNKEAQDVLDSQIAKLITFKPIFGLVFMYLNKIQTRDVPTMGVGVVRRVDLGLYYNPEWMLSLTRQEIRAVLQHEAMHILLHHITRSSHFGFNHKGYNIAADMAINCHLSGLPEGCFYPSTFSLPDFESSEFYYKNLKQKAESEDGSGWEKIEGSGELVDSHANWGECEEDVVKEKVRAVAEKAIKAQEEKGWSSIGSKIAASIIEANKPVVNWKREVRYFINKLALFGRTNTRTRINRREQSTKKGRCDALKDVYFQPGSKRDFRSRLLVAIDSSGSVTDDEISAFVGEINGMIQHVDCDVLLFDTKIVMEPKTISKRLSNLKVVGRGGTNFAPVCELVDELRYDGLVIMTDGHAPFPKKPRARVMWAITPNGDSVTPPWGKRVRVEIKTNR